MAEAKGGRLEDVTDARMDVHVVSVIFGEILPQKGWNIFVGDDILQVGEDE